MIRGGPGRHSASTAHLICDVTLVGSHLYKGPAKAKPGFGDERWLLDSSAMEEVAEANLVTSTEGSHFFGPLLQCDFPLELISVDDPANIRMSTKPYEHARGYRSLLQLPDIRCLHRARIRRLVMYSDFAQNSHKIARYEELRRRLRSSVRPTGKGMRRGVYLRRGTSGEPRLIENEASLIEFLDRSGFEIVDPGVLSAEEVSARLLDAPLIISVEGSHLSHGIFSLADRGTMLVLQPPDRFAMPYKEYTDAMDMRFAFLVGRRTTHGFRICPDELRRMLDMLT